MEGPFGFADTDQSPPDGLPAQPSADPDSSGRLQIVFDQARETATNDLAQQFLGDLQNVAVGLAGAGAILLVAGTISAQAVAAVGTALIIGGLAFGAADIINLLAGVVDILNTVSNISPCDEEALREQGVRLGELLQQATISGTLDALMVGLGAVGRFSGDVVRFFRTALGNNPRAGTAAITRGFTAEGQALLDSTPTGSALQDDLFHRAPTFMREQAAQEGIHFPLVGGRRGS